VRRAPPIGRHTRNFSRQTQRVDELREGPPDWANTVSEPPDPALAARMQTAIRDFFAERSDADADAIVVAERVAGSLTAQRGRAPDGREVLRVRVDEPGRSTDRSGWPVFHVDTSIESVGFDIAHELFDALNPDRRRTITFRPGIGPEHPLWGERGLLWLEDPELGLSEDLRHALEAWTPDAAEDWERSDATLNAQGADLLARVRAELGDRYDLVDDWRRNPRD
jgi:hypothetical protein